MRMREWIDIHKQLSRQFTRNKLEQTDIQLDREEVQGKGAQEETSPTEEAANPTAPNESSDSPTK